MTPLRFPIDRSRRALASRAALLVAAGLSAAACDPPPADEILLGPAAAPAFSVESVNVAESALPPGADLVLRFDAPVDPDSVGPRSVVLQNARRLRAASSALRIEGDAIRVPADVVASLAAGGDVELRIEGGVSPCALRSAAGVALGERYALRFRVGGRSLADLDGPGLVSVRPADGAADVSPGASVELRFDEPVTATDDAVSLAADGVPVPASVRSSADRRRVVVRPLRALPPGARVDVTVHPSLTDDAGNPLGGGRSRAVSFRVSATAERAVEEDFVGDEFLDRDATSCAWDAPGSEGLLVARRGALPVGDVEPSADLGDRDEIRFQVLVPAAEIAGGVASGVRLRFQHDAATSPVRAAWVEGGPADLQALAPSFQDNRDHARLVPLAQRDDAQSWTSQEPGVAVVEIPFEAPLPAERGRGVLLDVVVAVEPGARLLAAPDLEGRCLVRGAGRERLAPAAALLVSGRAPAARSLWYDSGETSPLWRDAAARAADGSPVPAAVVLEFQSAPAAADGGPDAAIASAWERDLSRVPAWRFVRFRVRFEGDPASSPALDRVTLPFGAGR